MKLVSFACCLLISIGINAQVKVSSDYDKSVDFSKFKTYRYTDQALNLAVTDLNQDRLIAAIDSEMSKKGFTKSDDPDIVVDINISARQRQTATESTNYYGAGYRYRWGGGFSTSNININDYVEGTIFLDFISTESNQLVWQGRGVGTVQENIKADKREKRINSGIAKILKRYPPKI